MLPIQNIAKPSELVTAKKSVLLDYLSPIPVSATISALLALDLRIAWEIVLGIACSFTYNITKRVFVFGDVQDSTFIVNVIPTNFYVAYAILAIYCIAVWIARPYRSIRNC